MKQAGMVVAALVVSLVKPAALSLRPAFPF